MAKVQAMPADWFTGGADGGPSAGCAQTGDALGYSGPWSTSYGSNLRQQVAGLTERQWLARAREGPMRPPMPGLSLQAMAPQDLKAIYRYIRWLGPRGEPAPPPLPPGVAPQGPVVVFPAP